jgi:transforming growth factor-beta-induced protein
VESANVTSIGFTLADKKAGPFQLEIKSVIATDGEPIAAKATDAAAPKGNTLVDVATAAGSFKTLLAAATAADLVGVLSGEGPFTVFAPTDEAFAKLPAGTVESLVKPENRATLVAILKNHVIAGKVTLAQALASGAATTLQGSKISAKFVDGRVRVESASLLKADLAASNGIIHVIDGVLLPAKPTAEPLSALGLIERAIERGVPLFNGGDHAACAAVYEITCEALRVMPGVAAASREILTQALTESQEEKSARKQAWILRTALDQVAAAR